jgi:hypothetical protein
MSLLKLLFDLPEAGGESNFTVEEQEELMAFEHNLDERLVDGFALPASDDQFGPLEGEVGEDGASNDPVDGPVDLPVGSGAYTGHGFEMANGVEVKEGLVPLMDIVNSVQNGQIFGSSTIGHFTQASPHVVAPIDQKPFEEPVALEKNIVTLESSTVSIPDNMPEVKTLESSSGTLPAITPATAMLEPAVDSIQEIASAKKYDISSKHKESAKPVWIKV